MQDILTWILLGFNLITCIGRDLFLLHELSLFCYLVEALYVRVQWTIRCLERICGGGARYRRGNKAWGEGLFYLCVWGRHWLGRVIVTWVKSCYVDKFDFKCTKHERNWTSHLIVVFFFLVWAPRPPQRPPLCLKSFHNSWGNSYTKFVSSFVLLVANQSYTENRANGKNIMSLIMWKSFICI